MPGAPAYFLLFGKFFLEAGADIAVRLVICFVHSFRDISYNGYPDAYLYAGRNYSLLWYYDRHIDSDDGSLCPMQEPAGLHFHPVRSADDHYCVGFGLIFPTLSAQ